METIGILTTNIDEAIIIYRTMLALTFIKGLLSPILFSCNVNVNNLWHKAEIFF